MITLKLTRSFPATLQLHRRYFTEALSGPEAFDFNHKYAPSVLATYLGSSSLISAVETLFDREAQLSARFLHFWFNAFSAAVSRCLSLTSVIADGSLGHSVAICLSRAF